MPAAAFACAIPVIVCGLRLYSGGLRLRGLLIVGELASRWGRDDGSAGRTVWFEIGW